MILDLFVMNCETEIESNNRSMGRSTTETNIFER